LKARNERLIFAVQNSLEPLRRLRSSASPELEPPTHAAPSLNSSRCGGGGDGGESRGRAFSGSDARTAPPHEVQLQARQAPHPHRYGRPSPSSSSSPSSAAAPRCSWCRREGKAAACRGSLSGSAALPVKSWLFSYFTSCTAFVAKKHGFVLHTGLSAIS